MLLLAEIQLTGGSVEFLCLCVCVFALYWSQFDNDLQISHTGRHQSGEERIKFWNSSAPGSRSRTLLNDSLTLRHMTFATISLISVEKLIGSSWNFYHACTFGQRLLCYILELIWIKTTDLDSRFRVQSWTPDKEHIRTLFQLCRVLNIPHPVLLYDLDLRPWPKFG